MSIPLGSRLRVSLPFIRKTEDGETSVMDLTSVVNRAVHITRPSGESYSNPTLIISNAAQGLAYWDAEAGVLDEEGDWLFVGDADGFLSDPVRVRVGL